METSDSTIFLTDEAHMKSISALIIAATFLSAPACPAEAADPHADTMAGSNMNAEQAAKLEASVEKESADISARTKLLGYYFLAGRNAGNARDQRRKHVLWVIRNQPDSQLAGLPYCRMDGVTDPEGYVEAKKLWLEQTEAHPQDPKVLGNAAVFFMIQDRNLAEGFLKQAQKNEPVNPEWADKLGHLYSFSDDKDAASKSLQEFESAQASDKRKISRFYRLDQLAKAAFKAGDTEKATLYANELLAESASHPKDWNYGNAIHHANNVLGLCALQQGDAKLAAEFLIKAGKTPGSPQLDSFGPNMLLAKALLKDGQSKDAVLEYFGLCRKFWKSGGDQLDQWTKDVEAGNIPDFGGNLRY